MASGITGTPVLSASPTNYSAGASSQLSPAIQTIWSKEILFQSMPILRFEQFAVKKTELGVQPGLTINFMRYNNLGDATQLVEGVRMETNALTASQFSITVAEHGYAVAVSELLLNASFDDVMASASRLLGRNMATYLDVSRPEHPLRCDLACIYGYNRFTTASISNRSPYDHGLRCGQPCGSRCASPPRSRPTASTSPPPLVKDAVETLATKNVPRLGETYVAFIHPHQSPQVA